MALWLVSVCCSVCSCSSIFCISNVSHCCFLFSLWSFQCSVSRERKLESVAAPADSSSWPFILAIVVNSWNKWGVIFVVGVQMEDIFLKMGFPVTSPRHWEGTSQRTLAPSAVTGLISGTSAVFFLFREMDVPRGRLFQFCSSCLGSGRSGAIALSSPFKPASSFPCKPSKAIKIMFCAGTNCSIAGRLPGEASSPRYHYPRSSIQGKCNHRNRANARKKMADVTPAVCRSCALFLFAHASCLSTH